MTTPLAIAPDPLASLSPPLRWLMARATPDEKTLALVQTSNTLDALFAACIEQKLFPSAIRLIAVVLPPRESVWWAWVSARHATQMAGGKAPNAAVHDAIGAVERWITRPDDAARREAWDAGNKAGLDTPIGMVSAAVFLSGTTVAPANVPPVPPPPGAAMPLVAGAITIAGASTTNADQIPPTLSAFAAQGLEIVKRLGGWDAALASAHSTHLRLQQEYDNATAAPPAR